MCENSGKNPYRAFFELTQSSTSGDVTFGGMMRTKIRMGNMDELVVSVNKKNQFDIDFEDAYESMGLRTSDDIYQQWRPCYKLNAEKIQD